jgi:serine/threonine protein kinase
LLTIINQKQENSTFSEERVRFYGAELVCWNIIHNIFKVCALAYLHSKKIVHRDVKLENVLLDKTGHIKLIDFGSAEKVGSSDRVLRGTLPFVAPEVIRKEKYDTTADWWSFGHVIYEMLFKEAGFFRY